jgi:hypothetical protein
VKIVDASIPDASSPAFWEIVARADMPLEVLVRSLRNCKDSQGRDRLLQVIIQRTQTTNEYWAHNVLKHVSLQSDERCVLVCDLCADLYEALIRALLDPKRLFWEENFLHCLYFERKHVYRAFMMREGRWHDTHVKQSDRIPRVLLARLDQPLQQDDGEICMLDVEDEGAQSMLRAVEESDLLRLVLHLPSRLKMTILLIFWEGRSEKDTARVLGVSDRTVRNRIREALKLLRTFLQAEGEQVDG